MAVIALIGSFEIYGLHLKTQEELNDFIDKMEAVMKTVHKDVVLEVETYEGKLEA